jgi:hypothetical protein
VKKYNQAAKISDNLFFMKIPQQVKWKIKGIINIPGLALG